MSINHYLPHLLILPEDEDNVRMANGFANHPQVKFGQLQILEESGGWRKAVAQISANSYMQRHLGKYAEGRILVLLDFDEDADRLAYIKAQIPESIRRKIFILGTWIEPQPFKRNLGYKISFEATGHALVDDCRGQTAKVEWQHPHLQHNLDELARFKEEVCPFLLHG